MLGQCLLRQLCSANPSSCAVSLTARSLSFTAAAAATGFLQRMVGTALAALTAVSTSLTASASNQLRSSSTLLPPPYRSCPASSLQHVYLPCRDPGQHVAAAGVRSSIKMCSVAMMHSTRGILGSISISSMGFSTSTAAAGSRSAKQPDSGGHDGEPASHKPPSTRTQPPSAPAAATPSESAADLLTTQPLHVHQQPTSAHSMIRNPRKALGPMTQPTGVPAVASSAAASAAVDAVQPRSIKGPGQPQGTKGPGLLQLTGTEQQLFAQALNYMPPQATAELVEVAEMVQRDQDKHPPTHKLLAAISKVLDLSTQFPDLPLDPLLKPIIAAARTRYSLDALLPKVKSMRRILPDTMLRAELLRRDPADVSRIVTEAVEAFVSVLAMQPPVQLLSSPRPFVRTLNLPPGKLAEHLLLLRSTASSLRVAQHAAQAYTGALLSRSAYVLLLNAREVSRLLNLSQDDAIRLLLRHPFLASSNKQLLHLSGLVQDVPPAIGIDKAELQAVLVKHPGLARYNSTAALASKIGALSPLFPGASKTELLQLCTFTRVRTATDFTAVAASLRTTAAIMGHASPAPLLPLLLRHMRHEQQQQQQQQQEEQQQGASSSEVERDAYSVRPAKKHPYAYLLQPAEKLAARALHIQQLYGFTREQLAKLARWYPGTVLGHSQATTKLKALLLQLQLLGDAEGQATDGQLTPEVAAMLAKYPRLMSLKHQNLVDRLTHLQHLLQLSAPQVSQLVHKQPPLLAYAPAKLSQTVGSLADLLGGQQQARALVLQQPKVLALYTRALKADGQLPLVVLLQELLQPQEPASPVTAAAALPWVAGLPHAISTALGHMQAAVQAAAAAVEQQVYLGRIYRGIRQKHQRWEMRYAGRSYRFATQLEAACAYDLAQLSAGGRPKSGSSFNFPPATYSSAQVQAMGHYRQLLAKPWPKQQELGQQLEQEASQQPQQGPSQHGAMGQQEAAGHSSAAPAGAWDLVRQLLLSRGGRLLLDQSPQAACSRLQALADLTGQTVQQVLQKVLANDNHYQRVMLMSPGRLEQNAVALQQALQLSLTDLRVMLRRVPSLLAYRADTLAGRVTDLQLAFQRCCDAAGCNACSTTSNSSSSSSSSGSGPAGSYAEPTGTTAVRAQQLSVGCKGMICLQQAALHSPELLCLSTSRVVQRLQGLQHLCSLDQGLRQQLYTALLTGAVARWLTSGDAHFAHLQELAAACSPLLPQLKLAQYFRINRGNIGFHTGGTVS